MFLCTRIVAPPATIRPRKYPAPEVPRSPAGHSRPQKIGENGEDGGKWGKMGGNGGKWRKMGGNGGKWGEMGGNGGKWEFVANTSWKMYENVPRSKKNEEN